MIKIKYFIHFSDNRKVTKNLQFGNFNEKNFQNFYEIIKNRLAQKKDVDFEQFLIFCAFSFAIEIRKKYSTEIIEQSLKELISKNRVIKEILKEINQISLEAIVDNFPKAKISIVM